jgi:ABC-type transporter Mla subunit MlaD
VTDLGAALEEVAATDKDLQTTRKSAEKRLRVLQDRRDKAVKRAHAAGASFQTIADVLGVHRSYVHQIARETR